MITCCWSVKGGVGTTVVTAVLAWKAGTARTPTLAVDLAGDLPAALGVTEPHGAGVAEWSRGEVRRRLRDLALPVNDRLVVLPRGLGPIDVGGLGILRCIEVAGGPVVVDAGVVAGSADPLAAFVTSVQRSLLVTRACFLALRRAVGAGLLPTGVVLVDEPGRALGARDVIEVVGAPVEAVVPFDPGVARAVDAGLLAARPPAILAPLVEEGS